MNTEFWHGKRVLVTGHTGFKGSWLSLWLQSMGAMVAGYALQPPISPNLFESARIATGMTSHIGDIRDLDSLQALFQKHRPELVIHMAAQPLVRHSYRDPVETYSVNVLGTVHVLEAARRTRGVRVILNITTDKCYENREWPWGYREIDPLGGHDPYSSSKACAELVSSAYRNSFFSAHHHATHGVALATARAGNVIGGGDWAADRLVPDTMQAILVGRTVIVRNPTAIRPWQHVLDPLHGYLTLAESLWAQGPAFAEAWNFGPADTDARPVSWVVTELIRAWGDGARWKADSGGHVHEAQFLKLDSSKARSRLGWRPRLCLRNALEWTVEWYRAYAAQADLRACTEHQIARYQSLPDEFPVAVGSS